ncbi:MAG: hypothetical protein R3Y07_04470 [Eubacteriales bacterium]
MMGRRVILALLLAVVLATSVSAAEISPVLIAEDQGNGYVYLVAGIGSFSVNLTPGETVSAAMFTLDDTVYPVLTRNSTVVPFDTGTIFEPGDYVLTLYGNEGHEGDFAVFPFVVENEYGDLFTGDFSDMELEENAPLVPSYDATKQLFLYTLPDGEIITSTVPRGGDSAENVSITLSKNLRVLKLYCDGKYMLEDELSFSADGSYRIVLRSNEFGNNGDVSYEVIFEFTIGNSVVRSAVVSTPDGMSLQSMSVDGVGVGSFTEQAAVLGQDGVYTLNYAVSGTEAIYTRTFLRDTTPPALYFDPPLSDEVMTKEVAFSLSDPKAQVELKRNGSSVFASRNLIAVSGNYVAEISDFHGNTRTYTFAVRVGNGNWQGYLPLFGGMVALGVAVMLMRRFTPPKVR